MSSDQNELPIISTRKSRNSRRTLSFFTKNYHFREPLKVLLDWPMTRFMFEHHLTAEDISRLLGGRPVQLRVTRCTLHTIKESCIALGLVIRKHDLYAKHTGCGHPHTIDSGECIKSMVADNNRLGFFVACGEDTLWRPLSKMEAVPVICHNGSQLVFKKPSSEQKQFAKDAKVRRESTPAYEERQRIFNYVSDSDKKLEQEAFELADGETLYRPGSPKAWRKRKRESKLGKNKRDGKEVNVIKDEVNSVLDAAGFNGSEVKGKAVMLSYQEEDETDDEDTGFQHFSNEDDGKGKRKKMGAPAGSSKHFTDENDSKKSKKGYSPCFIKKDKRG